MQIMDISFFLFFFLTTRQARRPVSKVAFLAANKLHSFMHSRKGILQTKKKKKCDKSLFGTLAGATVATPEAKHRGRCCPSLRSAGDVQIVEAASHCAHCATLGIKISAVSHLAPPPPTPSPAPPPPPVHTPLTSLLISGLLVAFVLEI